MKLTGARIVTDDDAGLIVSGPPSIAAEMRRLGATMTPTGWSVPPGPAGRVRAALVPKPRQFKAPARVIIEREELPEIEEMQAWFSWLPAIEDLLTVERPDSYTIGLRLNRHNPAAVEVIKSIPGRKWNPARRRWDISVRTAEARKALATALPELRRAIEAGIERDATTVRVIYPMEHAPALDKPIDIGGVPVRFFKSGAIFRLNEGHSRQYPALAPYETQFGLVFYGNPEGEGDSSLAGTLKAFEPPVS